MHFHVHIVEVPNDLTEFDCNNHIFFSLMCAYGALNQPQETVSSSLTIFSLLSFHQSQAPFWGYTCAVIAANVVHTNLPEYIPSSVLSHLRCHCSVCMTALLVTDAAFQTW